MRVLLVSYWFIEYCILLANALSERIELALVLPEKLIKMHRDLLDKRIKALPVEKYGRFSPRQLVHISTIKHLVETVRPQVVHVQVNGHLRFFLAYPTRWRQDFGIVATVHDPIPHLGESSSTKKIANWIVRKRADLLIVHGENLKRRLISQLGYPPERIRVMPMGSLRLDTLCNSTSSGLQLAHSTGPVVLFFGRIRRYKGLDYLIMAEPEVRRSFPNVKFVIAGTGDSLGPYLRFIKNIEHFEIHNEYISPEKMSSLFQRATVVVLPYVDGSQSGLIPLAYSFGKPVVVTDVGSLGEMVEGYRTGLVVPPRDAKSLAVAIKTLIADPEFASQCGQRGKIKVQTEYSWDLIAERTVEVYRDCVSPMRPA